MTCNKQPTLNAITVTQGADATLQIVASVDGVPYDATDFKVWFQVKRAWKDQDVVLELRSENAGGADDQAWVVIPQTGIDVGRIELYIKPDDTAELDPDLDYVCDCWVETNTGKHNVVISMMPFVVMPRVTVIP